MSYNFLNFEWKDQEAGAPRPKDRADSEAFLANICLFFEKAILLNHVNFSGMNMPDDVVRRLCQGMYKSHFLAGIHLSDNGIKNNPALMSDILSIFGIDVDMFDGSAMKREFQCTAPEHQGVDPNETKAQAGFRQTVMPRRDHEEVQYHNDVYNSLQKYMR